MKTKYLLFMGVLFLTFNLRAQFVSSIFDDPVFEQFIIQKYPDLDFDKDSHINSVEASNSSFAGGILDLVFTQTNFNGYSFSGIEKLNYNTLRLRNLSGTLMAGFGLDLSKFQEGVLHPYLSELTIEGFYFTNLNFANSVEIGTLKIINSGPDMNIENLYLINRGLKHLEIKNSGVLLSLNLVGFNLLDEVILTNNYIEQLYFDGIIRHLHIENINQLKTLVLPATNYGTAYLENLEIIDTNNAIMLTGLDLSKETNLKYLYLSIYDPNAKIPNLDLSKNTKLIGFSGYKLNSLPSIDFSNNTLLESVTIQYQPNFTNLDFSANTALTTINLSDNPLLTAINVSKNNLLTSLTCANAKLSSLDVSQNTALSGLNIYSNNISQLDLSHNLQLQTLTCSINKIEHLDVSANAQLREILTGSNQLKSLNIANGNNINMSLFDHINMDASDNPDLRCIIVDSNIINNIIPFGWDKDDTSNYAIDDEITINDANFKTALLNNATTIDVDGNSKISTCEAESFTGTIDVSNKNIDDMTGIEKFINATVLKCSNNYIGSLNLLKLPSLTELYCDNNQISVLDPSATINLTKIYANNNKLSSLDLSNNINLTDINFSSNLLTLLNTASNPDLLTLICTDNKLQSINVSSNVKLTTLHCQNNPFTSLNTVETTIDLSNNTALLHLNCSNTQITYLDVSKQTSLIELFAKSNVLSRINMANGNNINMTWMDVSSNPRLFCVQVDSNIVNAIPTNWTYDSGVSFSATLCPTTNCTTVNIPDTNFKNALLTYNPVIDSNANNQISTCEAEAYTGDLDVSDKNITDLTGLEAFINITGIICNNNNITTLDLSHNTKVTKFEMRNNPNFAVLILPGGYNLPSNKNTSNKISTNISLQILDVQNNALTSLDLSSYSALTTVLVNNNNLTVLNLQNGNNNNIVGANFNATGNPGLSTIIVDDVTYATTNWTNTDNTATFSTDATLGVNTFLISQFSIYPNPVNNRLNIAYPNDITVYKLRLYNVSGKMVKSFNPKLKQLFLYEMPTGVYFINAKTDKGLISKKLIKL